MKLKTKYPYTTPRERERFAKMLERVIDPFSDGSPYMPNDLDDSYWRVDYTGNNWTLLFEDSGAFRIDYRYNKGNPQYEKALFGWLKIKMHDLELLEE